MYRAPTPRERVRWHALWLALQGWSSAQVATALRREAQTTGAQHFFVDEAHFYADVDLHGKWVLKGTPALVDSTSPRYGEKASDYAAVCLETGEVEALPLAGTSSAETSVSFLQQLRAHHTAPLVVFWDNAPAHGGDPLRDYLTTPDLNLRLVRLPAYSPDFNAAELRPSYDRDSADQPQGSGAYHGGASRPSSRGLHATGGPALPPCRG